MGNQHKVAWVTGAGRGLGRALSVALVRRGWSVVGVSRSAVELEETRVASAAGPGVFHPWVANLAEPDAPARVAAAASLLAGPPTLVIHNASTLGPTPLRPWLDTTPEQLLAALSVNVVAPMALTRAVAGNMVLHGGGTLVFISSDAAVEAYPTWGAYGASKAALDQAARILAAETVGTGLRVLVVDPGEMDTRMHAEAVPEADRSALAAPEQVAQQILLLLNGSAPSGWRSRAGQGAVAP